MAHTQRKLKRTEIACLTLGIISPFTKAQEAPSVSAVTDLCSELTFRDALAQRFNAKMAKISETSSKLATEQRVLLLAAIQKQGSAEGKAYNLLAAITGGKLRSNLAKVQAAVEPVGKLLTELNTRRGKIQALRQLTATGETTYESAATSNPGNNLFDTGGHQCKVKFRLGQGKPADCPASGGNIDKAKQAASEITQIKAYPGIPATQFALPALTIDIVAKGSPAHAAHSAAFNNQACAQTAAASASDGVGLYAATSNPPEYTANLDVMLLDGSKCKSPGSDEEKKEITKARLANLLCVARQLDLEPETELAMLKPSDLDSHPQITEAAWIAVGKAAIKASTDEKKNTVDQLLGGKEASLKDKFFNPLKKADLNIALNAHTIKSNIQAAADDEKFIAALTFLAAAAEQKHKEASKATTTQTEAKEEDCKTKGKDEFRSEKCELKGNKFVAKEGVKADKDGQTTNTTGSNSFTIKKAPLLLAVLLLS
ncbi:variant surface protein, atypical (VSG), putative [Trypanosoma equiperdum]|uniref:Variant surface protein, atypical (VSG), putative n=1 Tax=Trypanosoma equiperdum TaxID=5694 RepID=A0A1G4ICD4_TRYEQ|nr:variant surface protein, atypical (VSG), putative [Trypanosoma equiperdum]